MPDLDDAELARLRLHGLAGYYPSQADASFIAEARTALPALLDEVQRLNIQINWFADEVNRLGHEVVDHATELKFSRDERDRLAAEVAELRKVLYGALDTQAEYEKMIHRALKGGDDE